MSNPRDDSQPSSENRPPPERPPHKKPLSQPRKLVGSKIPKKVGARPAPLSPEEVDDFLNHMPLDGNRPWLEQFEEAASELGMAGLEWLQRTFYSKPDLMRELTPMPPELMRVLTPWRLPREPEDSSMPSAESGERKPNEPEQTLPPPAGDSASAS